MTWLLGFGLMVGDIDVPARTKVLGPALLRRDRFDRWSRTSGLVKALWLGMGMGRLFWPVLWSVGVIGVVGDVRRWRVGPLWGRSRRWSGLVESRSLFARVGCRAVQVPVKERGVVGGWSLVRPLARLPRKLPLELIPRGLPCRPRVLSAA